MSRSGADRVAVRSPPSGVCAPGGTLAAWPLHLDRRTGRRRARPRAASGPPSRPGARLRRRLLAGAAAGAGPRSSPPLWWRSRRSGWAPSSSSGTRTASRAGRVTVRPPAGPHRLRWRSPAGSCPSGRRRCRPDCPAASPAVCPRPGPLPCRAASPRACFRSPATPADRRCRTGRQAAGACCGTAWMSSSILMVAPIMAMPRRSMERQSRVKSSRCSSVEAEQAVRVSPMMPVPIPR